MPSRIVDKYGRPYADLKSLQREQPRTRQRFNLWGAGTVSRSLTPDRLASVLERLWAGDMDEYLQLCAEIERKDSQWSSQLRQRKLAVTELETQVEGDKDDPIVEAVTKLTRKPGFGALCFDLLDGISRGFAVCHQVWDPGKLWWPRWKFWDPRNFKFDEDDELWRKTDSFELAELERGRWVVHRPKLYSGPSRVGGLAMTAAVHIMAKSFTLKHWLALLEIYGIPIPVGKYTHGAANEDIDALERVVSNLHHEGIAIIPQETSIEIVKSSGGTHHELFRAFMDYNDKALTKIALGATMTADSGSSRAQAEVHERIASAASETDAEQLFDATINAQVIVPFVDINFGPQDEYPVVYAVIDEGLNVGEFVQSVKTLADLDYGPSRKDIERRTGIKIAEDDDDRLKPRALPPAQKDPGASADGEEEADESRAPREKPGSKRPPRRRARPRGNARPR